MCKHVLEALHTLIDADEKIGGGDDMHGDGDVEAAFDAAAAAAGLTHVRCEQCWAWSLRSSCGRSVFDRHFQIAPY